VFWAVFWKKGVSEGGSNFTKIDEISIWNLLLSRVSHLRSGNRCSGGPNAIFTFSMVLCDLGQKSDFLTRNLVKMSFSKYPGTDGNIPCETTDEVKGVACYRDAFLEPKTRDSISQEID